MTTVDGWVITDAFTYRDVTYAVDAIAGDSWGTVLDWDSATSKAYVTNGCLLYTSPSPRDVEESRMPSSA